MAGFGEFWRVLAIFWLFLPFFPLENPNFLRKRDGFMPGWCGVTKVGWSRFGRLGAERLFFLFKIEALRDD